MKTHEPKIEQPAQPANTESGSPMESKVIEDPKLRKLMEVAMAKQEEYLKSPELFAVGQSCDEFMEVRKTYMPETVPEYDQRTGKVTKPATKHAYFGDPREVDLDVSRGYVPALTHGAHGEHVRTRSGMPGYWIPESLHQRRKAVVAAEDSKYGKVRTKDMKDRSSGAGVPAGVVVEDESTEKNRRMEDL